MKYPFGRMTDDMIKTAAILLRVLQLTSFYGSNYRRAYKVMSITSKTPNTLRLLPSVHLSQTQQETLLKTKCEKQAKYRQELDEQIEAKRREAVHQSLQKSRKRYSSKHSGNTDLDNSQVRKRVRTQVQAALTHQNPEKTNRRLPYLAAKHWTETEKYNIGRKVLTENSLSPERKIESSIYEPHYFIAGSAGKSRLDDQVNKELSFGRGFKSDVSMSRDRYRLPTEKSYQSPQLNYGNEYSYGRKNEDNSSLRLNNSFSTSLPNQPVSLNLPSNSYHEPSSLFSGRRPAGLGVWSEAKKREWYWRRQDNDALDQRLAYPNHSLNSKYSASALSSMISNQASRITPNFQSQLDEQLSSVYKNLLKSSEAINSGNQLQEIVEKLRRGALRY